MNCELCKDGEWAAEYDLDSYDKKVSMTVCNQHLAEAVDTLTANDSGPCKVFKVVFFDPEKD